MVHCVTKLAYRVISSCEILDLFKHGLIIPVH